MKHARRRLKVLRAEKDLTQIQVAEQAGFSQSRYSLIENGAVLPREAEKAAIASVLGVQVGHIAWPDPERVAS